MNKEFNDNNYQSHPHQEGQENNIAEIRTGKGINEPPEVKNTSGKTTRQEGEEGRTETESDRANRNEDQGIRGGNSSI